MNWSHDSHDKPLPPQPEEWSQYCYKKYGHRLSEPHNRLAIAMVTCTSPGDPLPLTCVSSKSVSAAVGEVREEEEKGEGEGEGEEKATRSKRRKMSERGELM